MLSVLRSVGIGCHTRIMDMALGIHVQKYKLLGSDGQEFHDVNMKRTCSIGLYVKGVNIKFANRSLNQL